MSEITPSRTPGVPARLLAIILTLALLAPIVGAAATPSVGAAPMPGAMPRAELQAQTLITAGLIEGDFDYPTSLVYRAYALFGDPRLPAEVTGRGSTGEDPGFFLETKRNWSRLPGNIREALTPFTVRPTDHRSRFFANGATSSSSSVNLSSLNAQDSCVDGWEYRDSAEYQYRIWMHCDDQADADFARAAEIIDDFWEREVAIMGEPIPDEGTSGEGGDTRIDFYFVDDEADYPPRSNGQAIPESAAAFAAASEPVVGRGSSAYVVARRPSITEPRLALTLAHEFFHVLQYAQNWQIGFGYKGTPYSSEFDVLSFVLVWFVEASADWMKSYIYRDEMDPEIMQQFLHFRFTEYFQSVDASLTLSTRQFSSLMLHSYGAYIYFLFLEQRRGPQAIGDFWRSLADVDADDFDRMTTLLDAQLPFEENFRDFAVQNFNLALDPGDPISPKYQDIDPTMPFNAPSLNFGTGESGRLSAQDEGDDPSVYETVIHNLSAHYYYFTPGRSADYVTFDFSKLAPNESVDIDMLVKVRDGEWERRQFNADQPITFCRADAANDLESLYVVVSNHALFDRDTVEGTFSAGAFKGACP